MKASTWACLALLAISCLPGRGYCKPWFAQAAGNQEPEFLPPDSAFRVSASVEGNVVHVRWFIADGYYLYREKMGIKAAAGPGELGPGQFPPGIIKNDAYFGQQEIFLRQVEATAPLLHSASAHSPASIEVTYQGCANAGLCYLPITKALRLGRPAMTQAQPPAWESLAIGGGLAAFFGGGLLLRRGRRLASPAS